MQLGTCIPYITLAGTRINVWGSVYLSIFRVYTTLRLTDFSWTGKWKLSSSESTLDRSALLRCSQIHWRSFSLLRTFSKSRPQLSRISHQLFHRPWSRASEDGVLPWSSQAQTSPLAAMSRCARKIFSEDSSSDQGYKKSTCTDCSPDASLGLTLAPRLHK